MNVNNLGQGYPTYGYQQPIGSYQQQYQMQPQQGIFYWVHGESGADSFPYPNTPNTSVWLMDMDGGQAFYIKSTDQNGFPQPLQIYDYNKREPQQQPTVEQVKDDDHVTRQEFEELKKLIDDLTK